MAKDTPIRALMTVLVTAVVCSFFVSASVVLLRPIQLNNKLLERSGNVLALTGLLPTSPMKTLPEKPSRLPIRSVDVSTLPSTLGTVPR